MFNNMWNWSVTGGTPGIDVWEEIENQCTWSGGAQNCAYHEYVNNTYFWNNYQNGTDASVGKNYDCCLGTGYAQNNACCNNGLGNPALMPDKQYWTYHAAESGAQAHGVGCGTLAKRPAKCTTGVAYWATDQSCSDLTGMVGAHASEPISGTLYKCTATDTWSTPGDAITYAPYTYPHPLRGLIDTTPPAAPSGLSVK